jgi:hypothetical protein
VGWAGLGAGAGGATFCSAFSAAFSAAAAFFFDSFGAFSFFFFFGVVCTGSGVGESTSIGSSLTALPFLVGGFSTRLGALTPLAPFFGALPAFWGGPGGGDAGSALTTSFFFFFFGVGTGSGSGSGSSSGASDSSDKDDSSSSSSGMTTRRVLRRILGTGRT